MPRVEASHLVAVRTCHDCRRHTLRLQRFEKLPRARNVRKIHLPLKGVKPFGNCGAVGGIGEVGVVNLRQRASLDGEREIGHAGHIFLADLLPKQRILPFRIDDNAVEVEEHG